MKKNKVSSSVITLNTPHPDINISHFKSYRNALADRLISNLHMKNEFDRQDIEILTAMYHFGERLVRAPDMAVIVSERGETTSVIIPHLAEGKNKYIKLEVDSEKQDYFCEIVYIKDEQGKLSAPYLAMGESYIDATIAADHIILDLAREEIGEKGLMNLSGELIMLTNQQLPKYQTLIDQRNIAKHSHRIH